MAQNIRSAVSINKLSPGNMAGKPQSFLTPVKYPEDESKLEVKRKLLFNEQPVISPKIFLNESLIKNNYTERNRYLDLFIQLNIIEDSFEFVRLIFHFDPFQCVYVGNSFEKIYGYTCKEIYERTDLFYEAAHPEDADFLMKQIKTLLKNGYNEFTYRIITKNGEIKYLKVNAWCQQDENLSYVINCYQKDVTSGMEKGTGLKNSIKRHDCISNIAVSLNSIDDFEGKLQSIVNKIGSIIPCDQVSLYEIESEHNRMVCKYTCFQNDMIIPAGLILDIPPLQKLPGYINTFQLYIDEEVSGFMHYWNKPVQVPSIVVVPIRIKQKIFGFIELLSLQVKRKWNDDDLSFVGTIGNMIANFFDLRAINDELNLNYLKQELLANVSSQLNKYTDDKEHVLNSVLDYIGMKKPDTERIFIYRFYENTQKLVKTHEYVNPALSPRYGSRNEYDGRLFREMIATLKEGQSYWINDIRSVTPDLQGLFHPINIKSVLVSPMFVDGQFYGMYGYDIYSHYHVWKKTEIEIAQSFAGAISHFISRQTIMKKLKASEEKFKDISAKLPGCVFQVTLLRDEEIELNYISPQFRQWLGDLPGSAASLEKLYQRVHPNDHELFNDIRKNLQLKQTEISFECRFFFSTKGFKWLIIRATLAEQRPSGECIYNGILIDVTENKQTETKLAEANVSIQSIINNLKTGILLVDNQENVLYINKKLIDMLMFANVYDMRSSQPDRILEATYQLVRDSADLKTHTSELMKQRSEERDKELFFPKSAEFITRDYIPVYRDGHFFAHLFIFNNITHIKMQELEIQKSYKRVRKIIDHSDIGILLLSRNEKVLITNDRFLRMHQITEPADHFVNQPLSYLWKAINKSVTMEGMDLGMIRNAIYTGKHIINQDICINSSNILKCYIEPIGDISQMENETHETLVQMIDITAQKNIEQTLRKAKEEAEVIAKAKSHILTSMSHEIRTPLNGILGFTSLLKETLTDPYHREMAEIIDQSGNRLMDTLNAILDFSVIQSEKRTFKITSISVNGIIQELVNLYRSMAQQKGLYLYAEITGQISIAAAEHPFHKILENLINNAIKYTIRGGVKIEAGITTVNDCEWLDIKVIDTGVGIDEFMHKTIFEPFRQESEGYGRAFEGTGLGLSLVKEYLQKMEGKIFLASRKDEGSTFTVLLPNVYPDNSNASVQIIGMPPADLST